MFQNIVKGIQSNFSKCVKFFESEMKTSKNLSENVKVVPQKNEKLHTRVRHLPTPTKSVSDLKEYRTIYLENGLTALLISDNSAKSNENLEDGATNNDFSEEESDGSSSDKSESEDSCCMDDKRKLRKSKNSTKDNKFAALGLCVKVGSFSDPWEIQGMAHFVEHMVFMGSEKFPVENDFDAFIKKRGGSDNASTDCEYTTFYFECQEKHLKEAILKFSQFFIAPLMKREAMTREREAIESEFQMSITDEENRTQQLLCSLAHPKNPTRKFTWGNLITLRDNISDDELYVAAHKFREIHYSAHRMTLAVQAQLSLEILESWVCENFSSIPNNNLPPDDFKSFADGAFNTPEFKKMYWVEPVNDICEVKLTWAFPSLLHMYRSKPDDYLASLIGHEGVGSLLAYLRKKAWALDITAGNERQGSETNSMFTLFVISIDLTIEGFEHLHEVLNAVFSYIKMIQNNGPSEQYFRELQVIEETKFRFSEESPSDEYVEMLAENMQLYSPEDYITGSELFFEYDPGAIKRCLDALKPDAVNIMISSKLSKKEYDKTEPWFQSKYFVSDIPNDWLESWINIEPDPSFRMPQPNDFITTDFSLLQFPEGEQDKDSSCKLYPVKVQGDEFSEVWYLQDRNFKLPQAYFYYYLISPLPLHSPKNAAMLDLYVRILMHFLAEELYPAEEAGLHFSISASSKGIILQFTGFNQNLQLLLEAVLTCMASLKNNLTSTIFDALKDSLSKYYYNSFHKPPKLGKEIYYSILLDVHWSHVERHAVLPKISMSALIEFAQDFVENLYIKSLVQGNVTELQAVELCNKIVEILKCDPLTPNTFPQHRVNQIPLGEHVCCVKSFSSQDPNSFVTNYYQSGPLNLRNSCIVDLIMLIMEEPVFDILRTKEQLGYDVHSETRDTYGILGFSVTVNCKAEKHSVEHVDERIEAFLKKFSKTLKKMHGNELEEIRQSLIKLKLMADVNLEEEVSRNWEEIISNDYLFDRLDKEVSILKEIKMSEIKKWYNNHILPGNRSNLRKLSVQVKGNSDLDETSKTQNSTDVCRSRSCSTGRSDSKSHQQSVLKRIRKSLPSFYSSPGHFRFHFVTDNKNDQDKHLNITDIKSFKNKLYLYPVNKVCP